MFGGNESFGAILAQDFSLGVVFEILVNRNEMPRKGWISRPTTRQSDDSTRGKRTVPTSMVPKRPQRQRERVDPDTAMANARSRVTKLEEAMMAVGDTHRICPDLLGGGGGGGKQARSQV